MVHKATEVSSWVRGGCLWSHRGLIGPPHSREPCPAIRQECIAGALGRLWNTC